MASRISMATKAELVSALVTRYRRYHAPVPPVVRVLDPREVDELDKAVLRQLQAGLLLPGEVKSAQIDLGKRIDKRGVEGSAAVASATTDIPILTDSFRMAWREGERRPMHKRPYHRRKSVSRRRCPDGCGCSMPLW